jgi:hypothetical protein
MDDGPNYWSWIPRKLRQELSKDPDKAHAFGWGLLAYVEFNYITFLFHWGILTLVVAICLCLGLVVPKSGPGPLHGSVGSAIAVFFSPFGLLGIYYGVVYNFAKHRSLLK